MSDCPAIAQLDAAERRIAGSAPRRRDRAEVGCDLGRYADDGSSGTFDLQQLSGLAPGALRRVPGGAR